MPEDDDAQLPAVSRYARRNESMRSASNLSLFSAVPHSQARSSVMTALTRSAVNPTLQGLTGHQRLLTASAMEPLTRAFTQPVIQALASQQKAITAPAMAGLTRSLVSPALRGLTGSQAAFTTAAVATLTRPVLANMGPLVTGNILAATAIPSLAASSGAQRLITQITARTGTQMLAGHPDLRRTILGISRQIQSLEEAEANLVAAQPAGEAPVAAIVEQVVDDESLEAAWQDVERVLRSDKQLRRTIQAGAKKLEPRSRRRRKTMERILGILVWLFIILGSVADGEWTADDGFDVLSEVASELRDNAKRLPRKGKNPLQKNGPRRRRHRRNRKH